MVCSGKVALAISVAKGHGGGTPDPRLSQILSDPTFFTALTHSVMGHSTEEGHDALQALAFYSTQSPDAMAEYRKALAGLRSEMRAAMASGTPLTAQARTQAQERANMVYAANVPLPIFAENELDEEEKAFVKNVLADMIANGANSKYAGWRQPFFLVAAHGLGDSAIRKQMAEYVRQRKPFTEEDIDFFGSTSQSAEVLMMVPEDEPLVNRDLHSRSFKREDVNTRGFWFFNSKKLDRVFRVWWKNMDDTFIASIADAIHDQSPKQLAFMDIAISYLAEHPNVNPTGEWTYFRFPPKMTPILEAGINEHERQRQAGRGQDSEHYLSWASGLQREASAPIRNYFKQRLADEKATDREILAGLHLFGSYGAKTPQSVVSSVAKLAQTPRAINPTYYRLSSDMADFLIKNAKRLSGKQNSQIPEDIDRGLAAAMRSYHNDPMTRKLLDLHDKAWEPRSFEKLRESDLLQNGAAPHTAQAIQEMIQSGEAHPGLKAWYDQVVNK